MEHRTFEYFGQTKKTVERDASAQEIANLEKREAKYETLELAKQAKAQAKSALLDRLGITVEEAALLLS